MRPGPLQLSLHPKPTNLKPYKPEAHKTLSPQIYKPLKALNP